MSPTVVIIYFIAYCGGIVVGICAESNKTGAKFAASTVTATAAIAVAHFGGLLS